MDCRLTGATCWSRFRTHCGNLHEVGRKASDVAEAFQSYINMVSGLTRSTQARAAATARALLKQARLEDVAADTSERVTKLAEEIMSASRANRELLQHYVATEVDKAAARFGFARADDVQALRDEIESLRAELEEAKASTAKSAPAKKATTKRAPAKKAAAKTTAGKKTAAGRRPPRKSAASAENASLPGEK